MTSLEPVEAGIFFEPKRHVGLHILEVAVREIPDLHRVILGETAKLDQKMDESRATLAHIYVISMSYLCHIECSTQKDHES